MRFLFLTRCFVTKNIPHIKDSIRGVFAGSPHSYIHVVLVDLTHGGKREEFERFADDVTVVHFVESKLPFDTQCTEGMDAALRKFGEDDDYVYVLDDDNELHKDFLSVCDECAGEDAIVFKIAGRPELGNSSILGKYPVGHIDWANFITKLRVMRWLKIFYVDGPRRCEDGVFFHKMMTNQTKIRFVSKELAFYNKLPR